MIKQTFSVDGYWEVTVYWNLDCDFFSDIEFELRKLGLTREAIDEVYDTMKNKEAKAVTCSRVEEHRSVVIFNSHSSKADYISSIVHEAEHVKQAILDTYDIEDKGEAPAYTIGYLVMRMYEVFRILVCPCG